ncbi:hypothetical protein FGB62_5g238 [Gracilaria domingensis]|nr:hypothetical protein FGB62_5g238 [Gracilaria domingensis]
MHSKEATSARSTMPSSQAVTFIPLIGLKSAVHEVGGIRVARRRRAPLQDHCVWRTPTCCAPPATLSFPFFDDQRGARGLYRVSYAKVLSQCVNALQDVVQNGADNGSNALKFTIDFPPDKSEASTGTLVSRFENNLNFTEKLLAGLGVPLDQCERVGGEVNICDNINPQGGGETAASGAVQRGDGRQHAQASETAGQGRGGGGGAGELRAGPAVVVRQTRLRQVHRRVCGGVLPQSGGQRVAAQGGRLAVAHAGAAGRRAAEHRRGRAQAQAGRRRGADPLRARARLIRHAAHHAHTWREALGALLPRRHSAGALRRAALRAKTLSLNATRSCAARRKLPAHLVRSALRAPS